LPSSSIDILEVLTITLLAAMDPESPPSRHPTDAEEEDSPLQQSTFTSSQPMEDSYPKTSPLRLRRTPKIKPQR
jgi:hypothetical protein